MTDVVVIPATHFSYDTFCSLVRASSFQKLDVDDDIFKWLDENTTGKWFWTLLLKDSLGSGGTISPKDHDISFRFQDKSDAIRFKLTWL